MDIASLNRKLSVSWSAHTVSSSLSTPSAMEEVRMGFSKLEPKAKMGVLISLLNIDDVKKKDCAVAMKRLLQAASADKTNEWVSLTAGLVHNRLFHEESDSVESHAFRVLGETAKSAVQKIKEALESTPISDDDDSAFYYQPLEFPFLNSSLANGIDSHSISNKHFVYTGTTPNFIEREMKILQEQSQERKKYIPSMSRSHMQASSYTASAAAAKRTLPTASTSSSSSSTLPAGGGAKKAAPLKLSIDQLKREKEKQISAQPPKEPPAKKAKISATENVPTSSSSSSSPTDDAVATADTAAPVAPLAPEPTTKITTDMDLDQLFLESPLLTDEEKDIIRTYFSDNWESVRSRLATPENPEPVDFRFRLSEATKTSEDGVRIVETFYLKINLLDKQWTKSKGTKKLKSKKAAVGGAVDDANKLT